MATDAEDPGFLSRWSRRKTLQRQGVALLDPAAPVAPTSPAASLVGASRVAAPVPVVSAAALVTDRPSVGTRSAVEPGPAGPTAEAPAAPAAPREPAPTLADVAVLTRESDFTPFLRPGVQPEVKNAALAKLFTDPHFNVMDGLDIYIDDYGKPDPLPPGMLRMMVQAHTLGLFDDEEDEEDEEDDKKIDEKPDEKQAPQLLNPAPADASAPPLPPEPATDEDTDLQLQPDDGAGRPGPEAGAGQDARLPH